MSEKNAKVYSFDGVIFDLDGVVTKTAVVHAASWKTMFDEYLRLRERREGVSPGGVGGALRND